MREVIDDDVSCSRRLIQDFVRTIVGIDERSAPRRHNNMANGHELVQNLALDLPEIRLALTGENAGDRPVLPPLDELVYIPYRPIEPARQS